MPHQPLSPTSQAERQMKLELRRMRRQHRKVEQYQAWVWEKQREREWTHQKERDACWRRATNAMLVMKLRCNEPVPPYLGVSSATQDVVRNLLRTNSMQSVYEWMVDSAPLQPRDESKTQTYELNRFFENVLFPAASAVFSTSFSELNLI